MKCSKRCSTARRTPNDSPVCSASTTSPPNYAATATPQLVLAGLPTIRSIHIPTVLSELAGAAVSEVNGYQRVTVGAFPTRRVQAHVASDLVHLLGRSAEERPGRVPRDPAGLGSVVKDPPPQGSMHPPRSGWAAAEQQSQTPPWKDLNDMLAGRSDRIGTGPGVGLVVTREIARRHSLTVHFRQLVSGGLVATVEWLDALFEPTRLGDSTSSRADDPMNSAHATSPDLRTQTRVEATGARIR